MGFLFTVLLGTAVWVIWNESLLWTTVLHGAVLSGIVFAVTNRYLLRAPYHTVFRIGPWVALQYLVVLIIAIFRSGIHAMYVTLSGKIDIGVVEIPTAARNPFHAALIATAITLTPGTVTIDYTGTGFKVIWIESLTTDPDQAAEMIKGTFERVLLPGVSRERSAAEDQAPPGARA